MADPLHGTQPLIPYSQKLPVVPQRVLRQDTRQRRIQGDRRRRRGATDGPGDGAPAVWPNSRDLACESVRSGTKPGLH
jgi:hypothetical protein